MKHNRGFTMTEMMVSVFIISVMIVAGASAYEKVSLQSSLSECSARLHQVGISLSSYSSDYHGKYPFGEAPYDFSDYDNWRDLWQDTDPGNMFFSETAKTKYPRLPRVLEEYSGDVTVMHCNDRGASQGWPEIGPYYYYTTIPWNTTSLPYFAEGTDHLAIADDYGYWEPMIIEDIAPSKNALVACQNPMQIKSGFGWRHGNNKSKQEECFNNHWYLDGSVKTKNNPKELYER